MVQDLKNLTHQTYEDPQVVTEYVREHRGNHSLTTWTKEFAASLSGNRLIDIGCGPGQYAYLFSELGLEITGVDYSQEMIKAARNFKQVPHPPVFIVADMRKIGKLFAPNSFDGAWMSASFLL